MGAMTDCPEVSVERRTVLKELFLDTETTGAWLFGEPFAHFTKHGESYLWDDITEIAVCDADGNAQYREYIQPPNVYLENLSKWYPEDKPISEKNTDCILAGAGRKLNYVIKELQSLLQDCRVVVHNLDFDRKVIENSYEVATGHKATLEDLFPTAKFVCSQKRAKRVLPKAVEHYPKCGERCRGHRLTHLHHQFGFGDYDEHNPLADVQALAKVWRVLETKS
jgi:DNA polymerase III epsilon subunit-like protein